jgi:hypothetical protein
MMSPMTVSWAVKPTPALTYTAPTSDPSNTARLRIPWKRDIIGRAATRSTAAA